MIFRIQTWLLLFACLGLVAGTDQKSTKDLSFEEILQGVSGVASPTGYEHHLAGFLQDLPGEDFSFSQDNLGGLYLHGKGGRARIGFAAPLDEPGFFVSGIRGDGYLTLDAAGPLPHPFLVSFFAGHPLRIWTGGGTVPGVMILPSLHTMTREMRNTLQQPLPLDFALIDVGAAGADEVNSKGISPLDAVAPACRITTLAGDFICGWGLGGKVCVAVLAEVAKPSAPSCDFAWVAQSRILLRSAGKRSSLGMTRVREELKTPRLIVLSVWECRESIDTGIKPGLGPVALCLDSAGEAFPVHLKNLERETRLPLQWPDEITSSPLLEPFRNSGIEVMGLFLPVHFAGTPVETVSRKDIENMRSWLRLLMRKGGKS